MAVFIVSYNRLRINEMTFASNKTQKLSADGLFGYVRALPRQEVYFRNEHNFVYTFHVVIHSFTFHSSILVGGRQYIPSEVP